MSESWLTVEEYAAITRIHSRTIRRRIKEGVIPVLHGSRPYRIPESSLKAEFVQTVHEYRPVPSPRPRKQTNEIREAFRAARGKTPTRPPQGGRSD